MINPFEILEQVGGRRLADDRIAYSVTSTSTETYGRTINKARHNYFVIDSPNGPHEALSTGEAFLAGIAACGVTLVQGAAKQAGIPMTRLEVEIEGVRLKVKPEDFDHLNIQFTYSGTTQEQAKELTEIWQAR